MKSLYSGAFGFGLTIILSLFLLVCYCHGNIYKTAPLLLLWCAPIKNTSVPMDPAQYREILAYSQQNSKLQVSVNSSGNVVMVPVVHLGEVQSPTDSLSQHITTHIITPEQVGNERVHNSHP